MKQFSTKFLLECFQHGTHSNLIRPLGLLIILLVVISFSKNFFVGLFFVPDQEDRGSPYYQRIPFEEVFFPSQAGVKLHGYFLKPESIPLGTIIHCHGNAGNVTDHHPLMHFLVRAGYQVLIFDYQGFGQSHGNPSPKGIIQDTLGAVAYIKTRKDVDKSKLVLFGQSLGGAAAAGAMVQDPSIRCLITEGTFTTYRSMAWQTGLGKLLFFITPFVIPNMGPLKDIPKIGERPILILHGKDDGLIPHKFAKELYKKGGKNTSLVLLEDFRHLEDSAEFPHYQKSILTFLARHL